MGEEIPTFIPLPAFGFLTRLTPSPALRELPPSKGGAVGELYINIINRIPSLPLLKGELPEGLRE